MKIAAASALVGLTLFIAMTAIYEPAASQQSPLYKAVIVEGYLREIQPQIDQTVSQGWTLIDTTAIYKSPNLRADVLLVFKKP